jgi:hypothetical protein
MEHTTFSADLGFQSKFILTKIMTDFLIYLLIAGLWIFGIFAAFDSKHIFGRINALLNNALISRGKDHKLKDRRWILRPLFMCNICMSSFHGSILGFIFFGFSLKIILFVGCLAGMMYVSNLILPEYE